MNDARYSSREPALPGPSMLLALVCLSAGAFFLRLFAAPVPGDVPVGALSMVALQRGEWWTVFTHIFTHANIVHLASNLLLLVLAGRSVERDAGSRHFVYIFLFSAWAGAALTLGLHPGDARTGEPGDAIIGASGGVMGIVGAFVALYPDHDIMRPFQRVVTMRLRAKYLFPAMLSVFLVLEVLSHVLVDFQWSGLYREAHLVHAGGLLTGWLYGRRLAIEGAFRDEWHDFFPQGLRRRSRESRPGDIPVAAGNLPERSLEEDEGGFPEPARELSDTEFLRERVDPVLEKLYATGVDALTDEERAVLKEASRRFSKSKS